MSRTIALATLLLALASAVPALGDDVVVVGERRSATTTTAGVRIGDGAIWWPAPPASGAAVTRLPLDQVGVLRPAGSKEARLPAARFFLATGEEVAGELLAADGDSVRIRSTAFGETRFPLEACRACVLEPNLPAGAVEWRYVERVLAANGDSDVVHLKAGSATTGYVLGVAPDKIEIETKDLGKISVATAEIAGISFAALSKPKEVDGVGVLLILTDGSRLKGGKVALGDDGWRIVSPSLGPVTLPRDAVLAAYVLNGRAVFVSDVEPTEIKTASSLINLWDPYLRRDSAWGGGPIRMKGTTYWKGLGVHARCEAAYSLGGTYERFLGLAGLDDTAREREDAAPSVVFRVLVDGKTAFDSGPCGARTPPADVAVDLRGAKELRLVCDFGDNYDVLARGAWAEAMLVKARSKD